MKKILCCIDSLGAGGAQFQLVGLASLLSKAGYEVQVIFYYPDFFYAETLKSQGVPFIYLEKARKTKKRIFHIFRYIRGFKPNVVISYLDTPNICCCIAKLLYRRFYLIVSERSHTVNTGIGERIRFNLYRMANNVVPNAFSQADYIKVNFSFLKKKLSVIPNFVDLERFSPKLHRRNNCPEIIVVASIYNPKNTIGFIDAVAELKKRGYLFHVSWYGLNTAHLDYITECQNKIRDLGVKSYIELKEKTIHIDVCYKEADYSCLPSFYEGTPNVICEAMACGLPIACSNVCDNSRFVIEGVNGFLFNPQDKESIVAAFERLFVLKDNEYSSFCKKSREIAVSTFSKKGFIESYIDLIEK